MATWRRNESDLERIFAAAAPSVPDGLIERLSARAARRSSRRRLRRLALAAAVSGAVVAALGAIGGISYAANFAIRVVTGETAHQVVFGSEMAVQIQQHTAATDQYGNPQNSPNTTTATSSSTQTISTQVELPPPAGSTTPVTITVTVPPGVAGAAPVTVHIDPTPPALANTTLLGTNNRVVAINITNQSGLPVHTLQKPLDIDLGAQAADYIPGISEDGVTFRTLKRVAGPNSPLGTTNDGYYVSSDGHIHILTLHTTIFAVLYKANLSVSESGRKLKPAGSGLFGDPTLIHPGKANLRRIGKVSVYPFAFRRLPGRAVRFSFFVDEQVAAYISVYQGGTKLPISTNGTMIRGSTLTKPGIEKNLHIVVLRPGTLPIRLRIPGSQLVPGKHYRIRVAVLDYDGNRTVAYIPFTG